MYIRSIRLRDWKAYVDATIELPRPTRRKNVVLIGAMNGYGKTSLLEALILALFGRDGLGILARAVVRDGNRLNQSYDDFLERALHARAIDQGRTSAAVEIMLQSEDEVYAIHRTWHFTGAGKHRREDEEVRIFVGEDREVLRIPRIEDREDFIRNEVAKRFLPVHLAQFFLFDGEQVQRLAQQDMAAQVRTGIEGMLGVPVLRELVSDLMAYGRYRRNSARNVGEDTVERLRAEVRDVEEKVVAIAAELAALQPEVERLKERRDRLTKELGSLGSGSHATLKDLYEQKSSIERERERIQERLFALVKGDLAMAIAGRPLLDRLRARIIAEDERGKWENGKSHNAGALKKLLLLLRERTVPALPPLTPHQVDAVCDHVAAAWESVWHPPPPSCAEDYRHTYLAPHDRTLVLDRVNTVEAMGLGTIRDVLEHIDDIDRDLSRISAQIAQQSGWDERSQEKVSKLESLNSDIAHKEARIRELQRDHEGCKGLLNEKKPKLAALLKEQEHAQPVLRRAALADKIAALLEQVIAECYPRHIDEIAEEMTDAYRSMAHKKLLKKVEIAEDCSVKLLGDEGFDMRSIDASAGENQIFALSLIAAIGLASKREFPIVMDTPLARLDSEHRRQVLKYFTEKMGEQVILLSQPDEVRGEYLDAIRSRICVAYTIHHTELGNGTGLSKVQDGYFEPI